MEDEAIAQARGYLERYLLSHPRKCNCVLCAEARAWLLEWKAPADQPSRALKSRLPG
jgi:hypothetical protein